MKLVIEVAEPTGAYLRAVAAVWGGVDPPMEPAAVAEHLIESALLGQAEWQELTKDFHRHEITGMGLCERRPER